MRLCPFEFGESDPGCLASRNVGSAKQRLSSSPVFSIFHVYLEQRIKQNGT